MQADLFQSDLINQKIDYAKKVLHKNIDWLFKADLRLIDDIDSLKSIISELLESNSLIAMDTETTGLSYDDRLCGISLAFNNKQGKKTAFYVPLYSEIEKIGIPPETSLAILKPVLEKPLIGRNIKFDWKFLKKVGIDAGILADISIMEIITRVGIDDIEFNRLKGMTLKERYAEIFKEHMLDLEDVLGKNVHSFAFAPFEAMKLYASTDAFCTLRIYEHLLPLTDTDSFIYKLETMLIKPVAKMELDGITIDTNVLKEARDTITKEQKEYEEEIFKLSGEKLNLNSGQQLGELLFVKLGLPCYKSTPSGEKSTDKESLERTLDALSKDDSSLVEGFKVGKKILETMFKYKENEKLLTAFVDGITSKINSDGKVHTNFNILGAISLRFSSNSPNLQQLPKSEDGNKSILRKAFVASEGHYLLSCDFSQVELRIAASFSQEPVMLEAYTSSGIDLHKKTASMMFQTPYDQVTKDQRNKAKTLNFGVIYGMGPDGLQRKVKCSMDEAKILYNAYFDKMPKIKKWIRASKDRIRKDGFAVSKWGWRRMLPNAQLPVNWQIRWEEASQEEKENRKRVSAALREGVNHEVQTTSSNITGISIARLDKALKDKDVKMLVQVHDQVIFEVNENILPDEIVPIIKECMELKVSNFVPLVVDAEIGYSWGTLEKWKPGLTHWDVPYKEKIIISGDLISKGEELKRLFDEFKGDNDVFLEVGGSLLRPESVDNDTGEVIETKVLASKKFVKKVEDLGLKIK